MENFQIERQMGFGIYGRTYLAMNKLTNEHNVLRMISCKDETHANEAFREASKIVEIKHIYISKVQELFVHFEESEIAFYLVIVKPLYTGNNCLSILQNYWFQCKKMDEDTMKKILVQIIEALSVLAAHKISHMNIKPENLFYDFDNENISVCDFGLQTILNDERRYIRKEEHDFLWGFPISVAANEDISKLDIWTIGMIFYAFMTTSVMSESMFFKVLQSTEKYNLKKIEETIDDMYSIEFVNFVLVMLNPDIKQRPGIKMLMSMPFFESCYTVYASHVISRQLRKMITPSSRPIPIELGPSAVLAYLYSERGHELCVEEALIKFRHLCKQNIIKNLPDNFATMLTECMDINVLNSSICEMTCCSLGYLAMYTTQPDSAVLSRPIINSVIGSLLVHPDNYKLYQFVAAYFVVLSSFRESSITIGKLNGLKILINSLDKFMDKVNVVAIVLNAIWNLCVQRNNRELAMKYKAQDVLLRIYNKHSQSPVVLLNATASLLAIITSLDVSMNPDNIYITYYLLQTLQKHSGYVNLVNYTLVLMENLLAMNEEHAMQCIECVCKTPTESMPTIYGLDVLKDIFKIHDDNSSITFGICNVINRLVSYEDLVVVMLDVLALSDLLNKIATRFKNSVRVLSCIDSINGKIQVQLNYLKINESKGL